VGFEGKRALVTGSTVGIGTEIALLLAKGGADVIVSGRDQGRGADVVTRIEADGGKAAFVAADLSDPASVVELAKAAGELDILVNNAAGYAVGPSEGFDHESIDAMFATNVRAPFLLTTAVAKTMTARGSGVIVNVSTMAASMGLAGMAVYSATKGAIESLTRSWAAEYGPAGVRVLAVAPGPTATAMVTETLGEEGAAQVAGLTILGRLATPVEIARVVVFAAGDEASIMTGAVLHADAGATAR
jgi:NAD(P)-dependent dehydrogenase (short-subunit alcohol dehydrogenase family)